MNFFYKIKLFISINLIFIKKELSNILFKKKENLSKFNNESINFKKYAFNKKSKKTIIVTSFVNLFEYLHHEYLIGIYLSKLLKRNLVFLVKENDYKSKFFFESLGVKNIHIYKEQNLILRYVNLVKSFVTLIKLKNIGEFLKFKHAFLPVGKMLYSHQVRFSGIPTFNKVVPEFYYYYSQYLGYSEVFKKILKNYNTDCIVQSETQFLPGSVLTGCALKKKLTIFNRLGTSKISLRKISNIADMGTNRYNYDKNIIKKIRKNKNSQKIIKLGKNILEERFFKEKEIENLEIDEHLITLRKKKTTKIKNKSTICKLYDWDINKPIGIIFANNLTDGLFEVVNPLYRDTYTWLFETLKEATKNKNINWLVKPHPREIRNNVKLRTRVLLSDFNRYDHIKILPENYKPKELLKIVNVVFTSHGTAGYEYPAFGIPTINASDATYSGLNITIRPKSIIDYQNLIQNLHLNYHKFKFDRKNASLFAYVWSNLGLVEFPAVPIKKKSYSYHKNDYWKEMKKTFNKFEKKNNSDITNDIAFQSIKYQLDKNKKHTLDLKILKKFKISY